MHEIKIIELNVQPEHIHCVVLVRFSFSASKVLQLLKGISAKLYFQHKEKAKLINALLSKTPEQFRDLELTNKIEPIITQPQAPDLIAEEDLTDAEFFKNVVREGNG